MTIKKLILPTLLAASLLLNVFQWLVMKHKFIIGAKVQFTNEIPEFTEKEIGLIKQATPAFTNISSLTASHYIEEIEETEENFIFHFSTLERLRDYDLSINGYTGYDRSSRLLDGAFIMIFDKDMSLQKVEGCIGVKILDENHNLSNQGMDPTESGS